MIASVGSNGKTVEPIGHGQHSADPWVCPLTGPLFFFANDARLSAFGHDLYENNKGAINVTVKRAA
jgi:hypothetical protein